MKRLTLLAKVILIITLGFVSLLHAETLDEITRGKPVKVIDISDPSKVDPALRKALEGLDHQRAAEKSSEATRYSTGPTDWKRPYDNYEWFLKTVEKGFWAITEVSPPVQTEVGAEPIVKTKHEVKADDIEKLKKAHEVVLKYRAGVVECAKKDDKSSISLKGFLDEFQTWLTNIFVKTDSDKREVRDLLKKEGTQILVKKEKMLSYIAAFDELQKKKSGMQNVNGKLDEVSSGDTKLKEQLLSVASVLLGKEVKIDESKGTVGDVKIDDLKKADATQSIFNKMNEITSGMDDKSDACLIKWAPSSKPEEKKDEKKDPKKDEPTTPIKPGANPLNPEAGKPGTGTGNGAGAGTGDGTTNPAATTPVVTPGTPGSATNGDVEAQRVAAEQDALRAAREAQERLNRDLEDDDRDQNDLNALGQLIRGLQPNNRSAQSDRSNQGPQLSLPSPSGAGSGGGNDGQSPYVPPTPVQPQGNDGFMAQLLPMLLNRNSGSGDINPQLLRAALENKEKEVPYVAPVAPLVNPRETALLDTIRMMMGGMAGQMFGGAAAGARPNVYGSRAASIQNFAGGPSQIRSVGMNRMSATSGSQAQLGIPGARGKAPSRITGSR